MKYQFESMNVSMVSVSRLAGPPHFGQVVFTNTSCARQRRFARRLELGVVRQQHRQLAPPAPARSPSVGQCTIGIGVPQ